MFILITISLHKYGALGFPMAAMASNSPTGAIGMVDGFEVKY
jgi:hypothetical protein